MTQRLKTRKLITQMALLYGGFSILFIFVSPIFRLETAIFCGLITLLGIISKLRFEQTQRWLDNIVFLSLNPAILFLVGGIRIWMNASQISPIVIAAIFFAFWLIYPFQTYFPDLSDRVVEEAVQPKSWLGKIVFRYMLFVGIGGATLGRTLARSGTSYGLYLLGSLGILAGLLFQFYLVHGSRGQRAVILNRT
jgi:hypothetical protein